MSAAVRRAGSPNQETLAPFLPPELEREIFLLTARSYRGVSTRLMLVASRVKVWIETFVYKTVVLRGPGHAFRFMYVLANRSPEFAKTHVKALCIRPQIPHSLIIQLLTVCSGLESLALWVPSQSETPTELVSLLSSLPLALLSLNLTAIISPSHPKPVLQNHPVFENLTHLDVVNHWALWTSSLGIERLPHVTHMAFRFWSRGSVNAALSLILRESPALQVLILLADFVVIPGARRYLEKEGIEDSRVVIMKHLRDADEWETMERETEGMWHRAERIVRWRRLTRAGPFDFPQESS
ncbi:hypothetical protein HYDPIDRAFT_112207 [Hydnomerulius pinastri MD-312]|uniref:F-box domain-containing protein n=1 Tax=Hydnomerulius pinastri MD-312 TaxID=994086 RepID=A0A0C9WEV2_9AGAM|nr:hypothetical protein HYDPIDRAFT_112207 [Hydnomerulius pinastri MD-312]